MQKVWGDRRTHAPSRRELLAATARSVALLGLGGAAGLGLSGCGRPSPVGSADVLARDQSLSVALHPAPTTLDPHRQVEGAQVTRNLFDTLVRVTLDNSDVRPSSATSVTVAGAGSRYIYGLNPDGRWSDGRTITAQDWVYGLNRLMDPATASPHAATFTSIVAGVSALDDVTLAIDLHQPVLWFKWLPSLWYAVPVREDMVGADPEGWAERPATAVSNGMFRLTRYRQGKGLSMERNAGYAGSAPQLTRIDMPFLDRRRAGDAFDSGAVDMACASLSGTTAALSDRQTVLETRLAVYALTCNCAHPALTDADVRLALARAVDRSRLVEQALRGRGLAITTPIPQGVPGYESSAGAQTYDAAVARKLLAAAGSSPSQLGGLRLSYAGDDPEQVAVAGFLIRELGSNLGVTLSPLPLSSSALRQAVAAGQFDLALRLDPGAGYPDPRAWLTGYVGGATGGYEDPDFDQLMGRADAALDPGQRVLLYEQAQRLLCQSAPSAFLCQAQALVMVRSTVGGVHPNGADDLPFVGDLDTPSIYLLE